MSISSHLFQWATLKKCLTYSSQISSFPLKTCGTLGFLLLRSLVTKGASALATRGVMGIFWGQNQGSLPPPKGMPATPFKSSSSTHLAPSLLNWGLSSGSSMISPLLSGRAGFSGAGKSMGSNPGKPLWSGLTSSTGLGLPMAPGCSGSTSWNKGPFREGHKGLGPAPSLPGHPLSLKSVVHTLSSLSHKRIFFRVYMIQLDSYFGHPLPLILNSLNCHIKDNLWQPFSMISNISSSVPPLQEVPKRYGNLLMSLWNNFYKNILISKIFFHYLPVFDNDLDLWPLDHLTSNGYFMQIFVRFHSLIDLSVFLWKNVPFSTRYSPTLFYVLIFSDWGRHDL